MILFSWYRNEIKKEMESTLEDLQLNMNLEGNENSPEFQNIEDKLKKTHLELQEKQSEERTIQSQLEDLGNVTELEGEIENLRNNNIIS